MVDDARFEDGGEQPLRLKALDAEDLSVMAALVQDAVFPAAEMRFDRKARRFALLINRFRWEDADRAEARKRDFEYIFIFKHAARAFIAVERLKTGKHMIGK